MTTILSEVRDASGDRPNLKILSELASIAHDFALAQARLTSLISQVSSTSAVIELPSTFRLDGRPVTARKDGETDRSPETIEKVLAMWAAGSTRQQIAEIVGWSVPQLKRFLEHQRLLGEPRAAAHRSKGALEERRLSTLKDRFDRPIDFGSFSNVDEVTLAREFEEPIVAVQEAPQSPEKGEPASVPSLPVTDSRIEQDKPQDVRVEPAELIEVSPASEPDPISKPIVATTKAKPAVPVPRKGGVGDSILNLYATTDLTHAQIADEVETTQATVQVTISQQATAQEARALEGRRRRLGRVAPPAAVQRDNTKAPATFGAKPPLPPRPAQEALNEAKPLPAREPIPEGQVCAVNVRDRIVTGPLGSWNFFNEMCKVIDRLKTSQLIDAQTVRKMSGFQSIETMQTAIKRIKPMLEKIGLEIVYVKPIGYRLRTLEEPAS